MPGKIDVGQAGLLDSAAGLALQNIPSCAAAARLQAAVEREAHGTNHALRAVN